MPVNRCTKIYLHRHVGRETSVWKEEEGVVGETTGGCGTFTNVRESVCALRGWLGGGGDRELGEEGVT